MSTLRQIALGIALIAAIAGLIWSQQTRLESAQGAKVTAEQQAEQAQQKIGQRDTVIHQLQGNIEQERTAQIGLRNQQAQLQQQLRQRERTIEDLKHENEELRQWADVPLPDAARRLRQRPAITGAASYYDHLSRSNAVHAERHSPQQERRPTD